INRAFHLFKQKLHEVELLIGYEGNAFAFTGNVEEDLLSITAVHPMREDAVEQFLQRAGSGWNIVERLIRQGKLIESVFQGNKFYLRKLKRGEKAA
ncbi:radical SAM protein, partial [candidate division KSB1 bacterium 4484_188]